MLSQKINPNKFNEMITYTVWPLISTKVKLEISNRKISKKFPNTLKRYLLKSVPRSNIYIHVYNIKIFREGYIRNW